MLRVSDWYTDIDSTALWDDNLVMGWLACKGEYVQLLEIIVDKNWEHSTHCMHKK